MQLAEVYSPERAIATSKEMAYSSPPIIIGELPQPFYSVLLATPLEEAIRNQYVTNFSRAGIILDHRPDLTQQELAEIIGNYDAAIIRSNLKIFASTLEWPGRLKIIGRAGVGVDNIDQEAANERAIYVFNTPEASTYSVADLAIALMLSTARKIPQTHGNMVEGKSIKLHGIELRDKTLGIIGLGRIGREVAIRAKGFGMNLLAYDLFPSERVAEELGVTLLPFEEVIKRSDFITLHTPAATKPIITSYELSLMKPTAILINTARGILINEEDLIEALEERRIGGAGLDVLKDEKNINPRLRALGRSDKYRVVLTPHIGGETDGAQPRIADVLCGKIIAALNGEQVRDVNNRIIQLAA